MTNQTPYQILGLTETATLDDAKRHYRQLAKQYHPDHNAGDKTAEDRFKQISSAYDAIQKGWRPGMPMPGQASPGHPWPRQTGASDGHGFFHFNFGQTLDELMMNLHAQAQRRSLDVTMECHLSLEEAYTGTTIAVANPIPGQPALRVPVPAGVDSGSRLKIPQTGHRGMSGGVPGDLYIIIRVVPHQRFSRTGDDLMIEAKVDMLTLLTERQIQLTGLLGNRIEVTVPLGFACDQPLRLAGRGMPRPQAGGHGDLLVYVVPTVPDRLSEQQCALLRQVAGTDAVSS